MVPFYIQFVYLNLIATLWDKPEGKRARIRFNCNFVGQVRGEESAHVKMNAYIDVNCRSAYVA